VEDLGGENRKERCWGRKITVLGKNGKAVSGGVTSNMGGGTKRGGFIRNEKREGKPPFWGGGGKKKIGGGGAFPFTWGKWGDKKKKKRGGLPQRKKRTTFFAKGGGYSHCFSPKKGGNSEKKRKGTKGKREPPCFEALEKKVQSAGKGGRERKTPRCNSCKVTKGMGI